MPVIAVRFAAFLALVLFSSLATAQPTPAQVLVTPVTAGLTGPIGVFNAGDGSPRLFVVQQGGQVRVVRKGLLQATPYLALSTATQCRATPTTAPATVGFVNGGEQGLLGLAFHPEYEHNGFVFASFTAANGDSLIARFELANSSDDTLSAEDLATCLVVLRVDQDFPNHNGGNILFGPDGYLYFGLGDGGSGNDPCNRGQTLRPADLAGNDGNNSGCPSDSAFVNSGGNANSRALLGKLLRIDVDGTTPAGANGLCASQTGASAGAANYAIPADNPYSEPGDTQDRCDEIWAYGLRNPWRFSFDRVTGDLFVGDVGQDSWEEVSFVAAGSPFGHNFDWKVCEGTHLRGTCNACGGGAASEVVIEYENSGNACASTPVDGCSVTGGFRYRGPDPILQGVYFYGDACNAELYYSTESAGAWTQPDVGNTVGSGFAGSILSFGEDQGGALHAVAGGTLYRIGIADELFENSFE